MRRLLKILGLLLVLLLVAAVAVPFLVPADKLKGEVLAQIEQRTGRQVSIDHLTFALLPSIALDAEGVKISNPDWAGGGNMAEIKTLKLGVELFPLLHKEVRLKELTLEEPVLLLVKKQGRANWDFSQPSKNTPAAAQAGETSQTSGASKSLGDLHLNLIAIKNGSVTYKDDASPRPESVSNLDFKLKAPDLNEKAVIELSALYNAKKLDVALTLDKPFAFENGEPTNIELKASYAPYDFQYAGTASIIKGIPDLTGKLTIPSINTSDFASKDSDSKAQKPVSEPAAKPENASRWSDAPIPLEGLARANANLQFSIGSLTLPKTTLKDINATLKLQNGSLQLATSPINAYGGTIQLSLSATSTGAMSVNFSAAGAQAEPLLHDFASYDRLSGTIDLKTALTATGRSQRALVNSLGGNGSVQFKNGKLKGVNLAGMLRKVTGGGQGEDQDTDFSDLSGTYTASRGIITTNDFKMNSPLLRVTGTGNADLPNWQEHFLLKPMLVASTQGQGGKDAKGIVIPVKVDGPLDHPQYAPDFAAALQDNLANIKDPAQLKQGIRDLKNNLLNGNGGGGGGLKNLLR